MKLAKLSDLEDQQRHLVKARQESILSMNEKYNSGVYLLRKEIDNILRILATYGERKDEPM